MIRSLVLVMALLVGTSGAFASQCPALMAEIDAAIETASISDADMERVRELRAQGEDLHSAGDHPGSEAALNEAKRLLGI